MPDGVVLCEYDHGRYTSRRILAKLGAFRSATRLDGKRIVGTVWGAPTERRAARLRSLGAGEVLACGGGCFERGAGVAVGFGQGVSSLLQTVRPAAALGIGRRDLGHQRRALFGAPRRRAANIRTESPALPWIRRTG